MKTLFTFEETTNLNCYHCGKDLLNPPNGHLLFKNEWKDDQMTIIDIRCLCRSCDWNDPYRDWAWKDISDLLIPDYFIQWIIGIIVSLHQKQQTFSDEAMENLQKVLFIIFPKISKEITDAQKKVFQDLHLIPRYLGGLG
jgi:hypothetical protein